MHRTDVVLIGPLEPLLRRPLRVPLPLAIAITVMLLCAGLVVTAILTLRPALDDALPFRVSGRDSSQAKASVLVVSRPAGATVVLDHRALGQTPATVSVASQDLLVLHRDGFLDAFVPASGPSLDVPLWRAQPDVRRLRPPMPGVTINSADFLRDGRVALAVGQSPSGERQVWVYDPTAARTDRLGGVDAPGAAASGVAVAPDTMHTATIVHLEGLDGAAADQLTVDGPAGQRQPLSAVSVGERLLDASWSPESDGVLVLSRRQIPGGARYHLRFVATDGQVRDLADLPGEPVNGSWVWAPDGGSVASLVHTNTTSLIALDVATGVLRYLDDLGADALPGSGAIAPAAWERSGDLLYAGPSSRDGSTGPVLFRVAPGRTDAHRVGDVEPAWAPVARKDGIVLTLARGDNDVLVLRPLDQGGHVLAEQRLGVPVSGAFAARWDLVHQQILITRGAPTAGLEVLLLRFGFDDIPTPDPVNRSAEPHP